MKNIKIVLIFGALLYATQAFAATPTLYFKTSQSTLAPGSTVNINVLLDTSEPINALALGVSYPKDKLEYIGSDNSNSIVSIWQEKPQAVGNNLEFSGGMLKSFTGRSGQVLTLQFKLKAEGDAKLSFTKTKLYLANGQGTEVSANGSSTTLKGVEEAQITVAPPVAFENTPEDVQIEQGLGEFKAEKARDNLLPLVIAGLFVVFVGVVVYNKRKRKI